MNIVQPPHMQRCSWSSCNAQNRYNCLCSSVCYTEERKASLTNNHLAIYVQPRSRQNPSKKNQFMGYGLCLLLMCFPIPLYSYTSRRAKGRHVFVCHYTKVSTSKWERTFVPLSTSSPKKKNPDQLSNTRLRRNQPKTRKHQQQKKKKSTFPSYLFYFPPPPYRLKMPPYET